MKTDLPANQDGEGIELPTGTVILRVESAAAEPTVPVWKLATHVPRRWRLGGPCLLLGMLAGAVAYARSGYTATSTIMPDETPSQLSRLSGLAAQFGFSLPVSVESGVGLEFYARLIESRGLLTSLAMTPFPLGTAGQSESGQSTTTLLSTLPVSNDDPQEELLEAVEYLRDQLDVSIDVDAGLLTLAVQADDPGLAEQMNQQILTLVERFNLDRRHTRAGEERTFIEERLAIARDELRHTEDSLENFLNTNRTYESSPELVFVAGRLQRAIDLRQRIFVSLSEAAEQSRIEEVRSTPTFTVVDPPKGSAERAVSLLASLAVGCAAGAAIWIFVGLVLEFVLWSKSSGDHVSA